MKKTLITCLALSLFAITTFAQKTKTSGAIQFESIVDPASMAAATGMQISDEMRARMPAQSKSNFELLFTPAYASYMPASDIEDSNGGSRGGGMGRMMMRFGGAGGNREYYYNFQEKSLKEVFDLNDTTYFMNSKLKMDPPKPNMRAPRNSEGNAPAESPKVEEPTVEIIKSDETKDIIGFKCNLVTVRVSRKMNLLGEERNVVDDTKIWYTKELGFDFSPNPNLWNEGAVLGIERSGNKTMATGIEYRRVSQSDVTPPKRAREITEAAYKEKMDAMMQRMRNMRPGGAGGNMRIMGNF